MDTLILFAVLYLVIGFGFAVVHSSVDDWQWSRLSLWLVATLFWPWLLVRDAMR